MYSGLVKKFSNEFFAFSSYSMQYMLIYFKHEFPAERRKEQ